MSVDPVVKGEGSKPLADILQNPQALNAYSYVQNNPVRYVDPTGMYEKDVHYDLTFFLGMMAGLSFDDSFEIAMADQGTDEDPATGPWASKETRQTYHFATSEQVDNLFNAAFESMDNKAFGQALHTLQDSYSHSTFGPTIGHIMFGHLPDKTFADTKRADFMAKRSFYMLRAYAAEQNMTEDFDWDAYWEETEEIWNSLSDEVHNFNKSITHSAKLESLYPELYAEDNKKEEKNGN